MKGRPRKPLGNIQKYDFKKLAKTTKNPRERLRFLAFAHIQEGKTYADVAAFMKVAYKTVWDWTKKFTNEGLEGLRDRPGRGSKPNLPKDKQEAFREAVLQLGANRKGGRIRGKDIVELLDKQFHVKSSLRSVYDTLQRVGLVWITGRSQHPKANLEAQEAFKKISEKISKQLCLKE
ncbi:MAG: winged helix-turn-helix domain-containing protein [Candidatus Rhabdochlamydia sp.]